MCNLIFKQYYEPSWQGEMRINILFILILGLLNPKTSEFFKMVPRGGIEPPTQGFSVLCSTD